MTAFRRAVNHGADAYEFDLRPTKDGRLVLNHDKTFERVARPEHNPGIDLTRGVSEMTLEEVKRIALPENERVPTLEEVLEILPPTALLNIELKDPAGAELFYDALVKYDLLDRSLVSSFDVDLLREFRALEKKAGRKPMKLGYLWARSGWIAVFKIQPGKAVKNARSVDAAALQVHEGLLHDRIVRLAREAGMEVHAYAVDDPDRARKIVEKYGLDAILSDNPALRP